MSSDDDSQLLSQTEGLKHLAVIHPKEVFVGEENLEGGGCRPSRLSQLGLGVLIESGDRPMKGVIACALACSLFLPQTIPCQSVFGPERAAHLNKCCCTADEHRDAGCFMSILGQRLP